MILASSSGSAAVLCETSYQHSNGSVMRGQGKAENEGKAKVAACLDMQSRWRSLAIILRDLGIGKCSASGIEELSFVCKESN
jgi:hypothetical protein